MVGLRYTRAKRRNRFISFISLISMGGIALGVALLIVVLSVMNGFQTEVRTRGTAVGRPLLGARAMGVGAPAPAAAGDQDAPREAQARCGGVAAAARSM